MFEYLEFAYAHLSPSPPWGDRITTEVKTFVTYYGERLYIEPSVKISGQIIVTSHDRFSPQKVAFKGREMGPRTFQGNRSVGEIFGQRLLPSLKLTAKEPKNRPGPKRKLVLVFQSPFLRG